MRHLCQLSLIQLWVFYLQRVRIVLSWMQRLLAWPSLWTCLWRHWWWWSPTGVPRREARWELLTLPKVKMHSEWKICKINKKLLVYLLVSSRCMQFFRLFLNHFLFFEMCAADWKHTWSLFMKSTMKCLWLSSSTCSFKRPWSTSPISWLWGV